MIRPRLMQFQKITKAVAPAIANAVYHATGNSGKRGVGLFRLWSGDWNRPNASGSGFYHVFSGSKTHRA